MAVPVGNIKVIVKRQSDGVKVGEDYTDGTGKLALNLPPGKYTFEYGDLAGHSLEKTLVNEPGTPIYEDTAAVVLDVDVAENVSTNLVVTFTEN